MAGASKAAVGLLIFCAVAACLLVLDSTGVVSSTQAPESGLLRGGRRLLGSQYGGWGQSGAVTAQEGMAAGSNAVSQTAEFGGQMAQQGVEAGSGALEAGGNAVGGVHQGVREGVQYGGQVARDALHRGAAYGGQLANQVPYEDPMKYSPQRAIDSFFESSLLPAPLYVFQIIGAVLYFCLIVNNYPYWNGPTPNSCRLQNEPAPCSLTNTSPANCFFSWCCPQARAAHTFDRTGVVDYWCGVIAMFLCPFCTLCWANACTDLNPKLGGEPANVVASAVCTWCCPCCTIAQDAESLDAATGASTDFCGVSHQGMGGGMGPYGGPMHMQAGPPGMMPGQQMMYPRF